MSTDCWRRAWFFVGVLRGQHESACVLTWTGNTNNPKGETNFFHDIGNRKRSLEVLSWKRNTENRFQMHYFGLLVAFTYACLHKVQAFVRYNGRISRNSLHLGVTEYDDIDFDDPYGFMGLEKEIVKDGGWNAFSVISENQGRTKIVRKARQNKSEYEKYLESRLGNLDAPMLDGSRWMKRLRESVGRGECDRIVHHQFSMRKFQADVCRKECWKGGSQCQILFHPSSELYILIKLTHSTT